MKDRIEDSFEDKWTTLALGAAGWGYYLYHFQAAKTGFHLLPPMKPLWYGILFLAMLSAQIFVWVFFKHFEEKWYFKIKSYIFFAGELGMLTFSAGLAAWPVFWVLRSKLI